MPIDAKSERRNVTIITGTLTDEDVRRLMLAALCDELAIANAPGSNTLVLEMSPGGDDLSASFKITKDHEWLLKSLPTGD